MQSFRLSGSPRYPKLEQFLEKLKTWGRTDRNSLVNKKKTRRQAEKRTHRQRSRRPGRCQEAKESKGNEGNKKAHQKRGGTKRSRTTPKATPQGQKIFKRRRWKLSQIRGWCRGGAGGVEKPGGTPKRRQKAKMKKRGGPLNSPAVF